MLMIIKPYCRLTIKQTNVIEALGAQDMNCLCGISGLTAESTKYTPAVTCGTLYLAQGGMRSTL